MTGTWQVLEGDALMKLRELPDGSAQTCVTSPPYFGLRDYGHDGQIGLEPSPDEYVAALVEVFREVRRVLRDDGTLWLNLGDSYASPRAANTNYNEGFNARWGNAEGAKKQEHNVRNAPVARETPPGYKPKDLIGIPWMVAFALRADGWYLRSDIIWSKPNPMPESVTDRPTKAHEYLFLLSKGPRYFYDADAIREPHEAPRPDGRWTGPVATTGDNNGRRLEVPNPAGRNRRSVWTVPTTPFPGAHFAVFPPKLIEPCILAGSAYGDTVLDPCAGAGTTGLVATRHGRGFIGVELNPVYAEMARQRIRDDAPLMNYVSEAVA